MPLPVTTVAQHLAGERQPARLLVGGRQVRAPDRSCARRNGPADSGRRPAARAATGMPIRARCSGAPTPESCRMMRRADRARRQDHLARRHRRDAPTPPCAILDADSAAPVEHDAMDERLEHDLQIGAAPRRPQIGARCAGAEPAAARLLAIADAAMRQRCSRRRDSRARSPVPPRPPRGRAAADVGHVRGRADRPCRATRSPRPTNSPSA